MEALRLPLLTEPKHYRARRSGRIVADIVFDPDQDSWAKVCQSSSGLDQHGVLELLGAARPNRTLRPRSRPFSYSSVTIANTQGRILMKHSDKPGLEARVPVAAVAAALAGAAAAPCTRCRHQQWATPGGTVVHRMSLGIGIANHRDRSSASLCHHR